MKRYVIGIWEVISVSIEIKSLAELISQTAKSSAQTADEEFKKAIEDALGANSAYNSIYYNKKSFVAVSPKFEKKLQEDPELAREISQKIDDITSGLTGNRNRHMIVIDRSGEITEYTEKPYDKKAAQKELDERKAVERARLRKKARLDAYFKLLNQMSMKRKLIEQENIKRAQNKRYRVSGARAQSIAQSLFPIEPLNSLLF